MRALPLERLAERLNADGEFRHAARFWTATLRFDVGEESHRLRFEDGVLREVAACAAGAPCDVFVAAPRVDWERLLEPVPRPFYQDFFSAMWRHGFRMNEDMMAWAAYYPALRRLVEVLREAKEG